MNKVAKRLLLGLLAVLVVLAMVAVGGFVWLVSGFGVTQSSHDRPENTSSPVYLMMIRDTRAGDNAELLGGSKKMQADVGRTDVMILARMRQGQGVDLVSIPRDTLVQIPACERSDGSNSEPVETKINAAYAYGAAADDNSQASGSGMACAERTVEALTGIELSGSLVLDSQGVAQTIDQLGGVRICATEDQAAALPGLQAGCHEVDGQTAFDFTQTRLGIDDGSDLARIERQHQLLKALGEKLQEYSIPGDIGTLLGTVRNLGPHLTATEGVISLSNARRLLTELESAGMDIRTIPVTLTPDGNAVTVNSEAQAWWDALSSGADLPAASP